MRARTSNMCKFSSIFGVFSLASAVFALPQDEKANSTQHLSFLEQHFAIGVLSFALKLTDNLYNETKKENVLFSPTSVYSSLCMVHLASSGATRDELTEVIGFPRDEDSALQMHEIVSDLMKTTQKSERAVVRMANGMFIQKFLPLKEQFNHQLEKYYDSEVSIVDFTSGPTATNYINQWISDKTKGHIPKIFHKNMSDTTRIALVNALFFSARWAHPFSNESTSIEKFDTGSGLIDVPMMNNQKRLYYLHYPAASFEAIALPYEDNEFVMYLALPYANQTLKNLLDFLGVQNLMIALRQTQKAYVDYKVPRIKFNKFASLKEELKKLGLNNFFEKAEFENLINSTTDLDVSDVMHGAELEMNEYGTVATASTSVTFNTYSGETAVDDEPVQFYVNRPFMFFICHRRTNNVMFAAMVHNPLE